MNRRAAHLQQLYATAKLNRSNQERMIILSVIVGILLYNMDIRMFKLTKEEKKANSVGVSTVVVGIATKYLMHILLGKTDKEWNLGGLAPSTILAILTSMGFYPVINKYVYRSRKVRGSRKLRRRSRSRKR